MKKNSIKSSLLAGIASLLFSFSALKVGALTDVTKPYLGEYECKMATYGKKDLFKDFSCIVLELRGDNSFSLRFKDKQGKMQEETGTYEYDTEKNTVRFKWQGKTQLKRDFLLENGSLSGALKLGWRTLYLQFEQK